MKATMLALMALLAALPAAAQDAPELVLRNPHYFVVVGDGETAPTITVDARDFGRPDALALEVTDPTGDTRLKTTVLVGTTLPRQIPGDPADLYLVSAYMSSNGVVFGCNRPWAVYAAGYTGVGSNGAVPEMFLYVPEETEQFTFSVRANSPGEGGRVILHDPNGAEVLVLDGEFDAQENHEVTAPAACRGAVWSITWAQPEMPDVHLEDINVMLDGPVTPVLWIDRTWAEDYGEELWQRHKAALEEEAQ